MDAPLAFIGTIGQMKNPDISLIIACYNEEQFLRESVSRIMSV